MSAKELISHFDGRTVLHIEVANVTAKVRSMVPGQRIEFVEDLDESPDVLRGMLYQEEITLGWDSEPTIVNQIRYNGNMARSWQRLVVCKELIHVLDTDRLLTRTQADVSALIERMRVPIDLQGQFNGQEHGDRFAEFQALAILFPRAARELLIDPYRNNKITSQEIADHAAIPAHYVDFLMTDHWEAFRRMMDQTMDIWDQV